VWVGLIWPNCQMRWGLIFSVEGEIFGGCFNLLFGFSLQPIGCQKKLSLVSLLFLTSPNGCCEVFHVPLSIMLTMCI
jgi:hypothetical protein